ncbi:trypsin [Sergentomyia squamirostris]
MIRLVILSVLISCTIGASFKNDSSSFFNGRIVGGVAVTIQDYPYQVSVQHYGSHMCGGSILSSYFVLTAADCTNDLVGTILELLLKVFSVRVGSSYHNNGGTVFYIERIYQYPDYNSVLHYYDVSLLKLEKSLTPLMLASPSTVKAIPLPSEGYQVPVGAMITVSGWGLLWEKGPIPSQLQSVDLPYIDHTTCQNAYYPAHVTDDMMCAGYLGGEGEKDACQEDNGGPAVYNGVQVGIISWGYDCADPDHPAVFADLTNILIYKWITSII